MFNFFNDDAPGPITDKTRLAEANNFSTTSYIEVIDIFSIFSFTQMQNSSGVFGFYAGTSPNDLNELLEASLNEWKNIKNTISNDELTRAKAQMRSGFIMGQESNGARAEYYAKSMINFGKLIETNEVIKKIESISITSIYDVVEKLFARANPVLSVIGPDASSLKKLNINNLLN